MVVPGYFQSLPFVIRKSLHDINTRHGNELHVYKIYDSFSKGFISIPILIKD